MPELSKEGREQVALALILLRDFKRQPDPKDDFETSRSVFGLAQHLGVAAEFSELIVKIPPMDIRPRP